MGEAARKPLSLPARAAHGRKEGPGGRGSTGGAAQGLAGCGNHQGGQLRAPSSAGVDPDRYEPALCLSGPSSVKWVTAVLASKDGFENL